MNTSPTQDTLPPVTPKDSAAGGSPFPFYLTDGFLNFVIVAIVSIFSLIFVVLSFGEQFAHSRQKTKEIERRHSQQDRFHSESSITINHHTATPTTPLTTTTPSSTTPMTP